MISLLNLISQLIDLYIWLLIISAVLSWLVSFQVLDTRNRFVYLVIGSIYKMTEPAYRFVRRFIPPLGGIDLSPLILIFGLSFLQNLMWELLV